MQLYYHYFLFLGYSYVTIIVSMIGKIGVATVFSLGYLWCSEFYPSTLRSTLVGLSSLFARVGSVLAPIIVDLVNILAQL